MKPTRADKVWCDDLLSHPGATGGSPSCVRVRVRPGEEAGILLITLSANRKQKNGGSNDSTKLRQQGMIGMI